MLEGNIYILHEVLEGKLNLLMHDDDDDDEKGPLHAINESCETPVLCLHDTSSDGAVLGESRRNNRCKRLHVCIDELILMFSKWASAEFTLRNVKAVHFSSSVPSGDSIRPVKQAFQISRTNRALGIFCGGRTISH